MCENCEKMKEEAWAEVRDVMNYNRTVKGPLSEKIAENVASATDEYPHFADMDEDEIQGAIESVRCTLIAERCAIIASIAHSRYNGMPPSMILASWAAEALKMESMGIIGILMMGGDKPTNGDEN